jgi:hypothetical protein
LATLAQLRVEGEPRPQRGSGEAVAMLAIAAAALATRLPFVGLRYGEADCARFVYGLRQWLAGGPHQPEIYGAIFSPGYYWLAAHLATMLHVAPVGLPTLLNAISCAATVAGTVLLYRLGQMLASREAALGATLLFLFTPGYWWLGIEGHPQAMAIALFAGALACFCAGLNAATRNINRACAWAVASAMLLAGSLLAKSDTVLMFGAYPGALAFLTWGRRGEDASEGRAVRGRIGGGNGWNTPRAGGATIWLLAYTAAILASASLIFVALRQSILYETVAQTQRAAGHAVGMFVEIPRGIELARQVLPMLTGPGIGALLLIASGFALGMHAGCDGRESEDIRSVKEIHLVNDAPGRASAGSPSGEAGRTWAVKWLVFAGLWVLPGYCFWFAIHGNNARHVAMYSFPLLLAACEGWRRAGAGWPAIAVASAARLRLRSAKAADGGKERRLAQPVASALTRWRLWAVWAAAGAITFVAVPPSSNVTLYPSGDVPASVRLLKQREGELRAIAAGLWEAGARAASAGPAGVRKGDGPGRWACYAGSYTIPYLIADTFDLSNGEGTHPVLETEPGEVDVIPEVRADGDGHPPDIGAASAPGTPFRIRFIEAESPAAFRKAEAACGSAESVEYAPGGRKLQFMGREISAAIPFADGRSRQAGNGSTRSRSKAEFLPQRAN